MAVLSGADLRHLSAPRLGTIGNPGVRHAPLVTHTAPRAVKSLRRFAESVVFGNVEALDGRLRTECVYSQVPAFSAADRAMIDVLALTRESRLAVVELKADEDIHLPLQGVDYWSRVAWHQERGEFRKFGYFPGRELSPQKPLLLLVAPALHVHPATDTILRYLAPEIECELVGIDENWREGARVIFRKRARMRAARA